MKAIAAFLTFQRQDLADAMWRQLPDAVCIDGGSATPIKGAAHRNSVNGYFTGNWNFGMKQLDADWVWMLNDDVEGVTPAMFDELVALAERLHNCAVITPAFNSPHQLFWPQAPRMTREVRWSDWTCPLVNKRMWDALGGFDEGLKSYGADLDYCRRVRDAGGRIYVSDAHVVHHLGSLTVLSEGTAGIMNDVGAMDSYLRQKWGVNSWMEMC